MKELSVFKKDIIELDRTCYYGKIVRDDNFKVIQVGKFKVGDKAYYTTPVRREGNQILRFEFPWVVFNSGRVEIEKLEGWEPNIENKFIYETTIRSLENK